MPIEKGSVTMTIFRLPRELPEDSLEKFAANVASTLDSVKDEPNIGWTSGRYLLERRIDEETAICGGHLYLNMRVAERKIPPALLNAECRGEELAYMQANKTPTVPAKIRREIKESIIEKRLMQMPPQIVGIPMVVDSTTNMMYVGTASAAQVDRFLEFFYNSVGVEPLQVDMNELMFRLKNKDAEAIPPVRFSDVRVEEEHTPGRDFLTWLWYYSSEEGGRVELGNLGRFEIAIDGPLTFAYSAEARGAGEITVKKGSPPRSAEAKSALAVGKKLRKAKLTLARGEDVWSGSFDADRFAFSGLSLPDGEEMEQHSRFAERVMHLDMFQKAMTEYFAKFVEATTGGNWAAKQKAIVDWAADLDGV